MGMRTVIALNNDLASEWERDPDLGRKIVSLGAARSDRWGYEVQQGLTLVECSHADTQTLLIADGYTAKQVACTHWYSGQGEAARDLALLKDLATRLGYTVRRRG